MTPIYFISTYKPILCGIADYLKFLLKEIPKEKWKVISFDLKSFQDSLIVSLIIILLLFLQAKQYLNWWNTSIFVLVVFLIIAFTFSTKKQTYETD